MAEMTPADVTWLISSSLRIMAMQAGFAALEIGSVRLTNTANIMMKNLGDMALGVLVFSLFGYGLLAGEGNVFCGTSWFMLSGVENFVDYLFFLQLNVSDLFKFNGSFCVWS